ncbi:hypothetical protein E2C01_080768 [Portunus trituberculatus]|uniref:Uncharacterized protein n=1 Tax=Portunus trituberculatus TaxID=210409 RepID=A0A5B7IKH5_PORTR|nr:hypothetical protein [Portunus trituberculatus]
MGLCKWKQYLFERQIGIISLKFSQVKDAINTSALKILKMDWSDWTKYRNEIGVAATSNFAMKMRIEIIGDNRKGFLVSCLKHLCFNEEKDEI